MQNYSYTIRLRIWHPSIKPDEITNTIGVKPDKISVAGEPRQNPKGKLLGGKYTINYWSGTPLNIRGYTSNDAEAENSLTEVINNLKPHAAFFGKLREGGGSVLLEICSYGEMNYAFEFSPDLLAQCANVNLSLVVDIYPVQQNW